MLQHTQKQIAISDLIPAFIYQSLIAELNRAPIQNPLSIENSALTKSEIQEMIKSHRISTTLSLLNGNIRVGFLNGLSPQFVNAQITNGYEIAAILKCLSQEEDKLNFINRLGYSIQPDKIKDGYEIAAILACLTEEKNKITLLNQLGLCTVFTSKIQTKDQLNGVLQHFSKENKNFLETSWLSLEDLRKRKNESRKESKNTALQLKRTHQLLTGTAPLKHDDASPTKKLTPDSPKSLVLSPS